MIQKTKQKNKSKQKKKKKRKLKKKLRICPTDMQSSVVFNFNFYKKIGQYFSGIIL